VQSLHGIGTEPSFTVVGGDSSASFVDAKFKQVAQIISQNFRGLRNLVSRKKRRFQEGGFDLDLSYVLPRLIAMGWPSRGLEAAFRNPMAEVQRFFEEHHQHHYKVYNICCERDYDPTAYFPLVEHFPMKDHNACPLDMFASVCESIERYLSEHPSNVVAVHCKAGKGRTGMVVAAFMLHAGLCTTAEAALKGFAEKRTWDGQGVTIPSQIRYVEYYAELLRRRQVEDIVRPTAYRLQRMRLVTAAPTRLSGDFQPYFKLKGWRGEGEGLREVKVYDYRWQVPDVAGYACTLPYVDLDCSGDVVRVEGDVKIVLYDAAGGSHKRLCHIWMNSSFLLDGTMRFSKSRVDVACKDTRCRRFESTFAVVVHLEPLEESEAARNEVTRQTAPGDSSDEENTCVSSDESDREELDRDTEVTI